MGEVAIHVDQLSKRYKLGEAVSFSLRDSFSGLFSRKNKPVEGGYFNALDNVSFEVKKGEVLGIIGKNGAGKSTLLKILSRITKPTSGRIEINGRVSSLLEVGTGFHPELTGRENIFLNGTILGMRKAEIKAKFDQIVDFSGVEKFIDTPVKYYSSGMYVRLAFAVAAHLEPEILIIDEVLAVGDAEFQKKCLGKMKDVSGEGRTVLFVSHDMQAVSTITKRSILLNKGRNVFEGHTINVINHYLESSKDRRLAYESMKGLNRPHVLKVELLTSHDNNIQKNRDKFQIEISLYTPTRIQGACLSVQVVDLNERNYIHVWTFDSDLPMCRSKGIHSVICRIDKLKLYMGKYFLRVIFSEPPGGEVFEVLENICPFEVVMYDSQRSHFQWHPDACAYLEDVKWEVN